jgi:hypothetical protein
MIRAFSGKDILGDGCFVRMTFCSKGCFAGRRFCRWDVFRKEVFWKNIL